MPSFPSTRCWTNTRTQPGGIGLATGRILVLDFDLYKNADALRDCPGELPETRKVITGGGGEHWYYTVPEGTVITNSHDKLGFGIDIRGTGGYVVLPPSPHISGRVYEWEDAFAPIAAAPAWLIDKLRAPVRTIAPVLTSHRNPTMASIGGALRRIGCDADQIFVMLAAFNRGFCVPPKSEREVDRIAKSIARYPTAEDKAEYARRKGNDFDDKFFGK